MNALYCDLLELRVSFCFTGNRSVKAGQMQKKKASSFQQQLKSTASNQSQKASHPRTLWTLLMTGTKTLTPMTTITTRSVLITVMIQETKTRNENHK